MGKPREGPHPAALFPGGFQQMIFRVVVICVLMHRPMHGTRNRRQQLPPPYIPPQPPRPRRRNPLAVIGMVAGAVFAGAVFIGIITDGEDATGQDNRAVVSATSRPPVTAGAVGERRPVPTPDAAQRAAYLAALEEIDPGLAVHEERAIRRGRAVCDRILNPEGRGDITRYTVQALSGGDAQIDAAQARQVIKAVRAWCR